MAASGNGFGSKLNISQRLNFEKLKISTVLYKDKSN